MPGLSERISDWKEMKKLVSSGVAPSFLVKEDRQRYTPRRSLDERYVQIIWHDALYREDDMVTASGKRVQVLEPGRWNSSRGPDFKDARIRIAGELLEGDIEIHTTSGNWTRHEHHQDFEYNRVVLHVTLFLDDDRPFDSKQNGERLERLPLGEILDPDLETIQQTINLDDYPKVGPEAVGICHEYFSQIDPDLLHRFLVAGGKERIESKVSRFTQQLKTVSFRQALYQSLMSMQGYKSSKTLYYLLAKRVPVDELLGFRSDYTSDELSDVFLAVLLHTGSLMPDSDDLFSENPEVESYENKLRGYWRQLSPYFLDRVMPPTRRWFSGVRPAGFPPRRLAGVAELTCRLFDQKDSVFSDIQRMVCDAELELYSPKKRRDFWKSLTKLLMVEETGNYFETRFTLRGKKQKKNALIGESAAKNLLFNVLLPALVARARVDKEKTLERKALELMLQFPRLEMSGLTKFMMYRLFGDLKLAKQFVNSEVTHQAMYKIFSDCCAENEQSCQDCTFKDISIGQIAQPE